MCPGCSQRPGEEGTRRSSGSDAPLLSLSLSPSYLRVGTLCPWGSARVSAAGTAGRRLRVRGWIQRHLLSEHGAYEAGRQNRPCKIQNRNMVLDLLIILFVVCFHRFMGA